MVNIYFDKIRVTVNKNCLHKDKNVYTIGIGLIGQILEGFRSPFTLVIQTKVTSLEGLEKSATFKKVTEFNKIIEPYGLYVINKDYSSFRNIFVYYECLFLNLNNSEIKQIQIQITCVDSHGSNVFNVSEIYDDVLLRWDRAIKKDNLEIFYSGSEEMLITETMVDELYNSYQEAIQTVDVKPGKNVHVYMTACPQNIYDIVSNFPIESTNSIAIGDDKIFIILDGRESIGISFSPHEFTHLLLNKSLENEISGADKAFIEGICEYVSERYRLRKGWLTSYQRALIGMEFLKKVYRCTLAEFLKKEIDIKKEIPFEYYILLPSIIETIVNTKKIEIKSLTRKINQNKSIYRILEKLVDDVDSFLEEYEKNLYRERSDIVGKIYDLYTKKHYIYSNLSREMSIKELTDLRKEDALFQQCLMRGDIYRAKDLLQDNS